MRRRRHSPAVYYDNYIPDTLNRPIKSRPNRIDRWSYLEKVTYYKIINTHKKTLEYIKKHGEAPPGKTKEDIKHLKELRLIVQRNSSLFIHKIIEDLI